MKLEDREAFDNAILTRPGEKAPPRWWKGEEQAAAENMAALAQIRRDFSRR